MPPWSGSSRLAAILSTLFHLSTPDHFGLKKVATSYQERRTLLTLATQEGDSILVPGAKCFADGSLSPLGKSRCLYELSIRERMPQRHRYTIISGGRRGVQEYLVANPTDVWATEGSLMARYCRATAGTQHYLVEPNAVETAGNLIF